MRRAQPAGTNRPAPKVYAAITSVAGDLARTGIAKIGVNLTEDYAYRRIDDVYDAVGPLLAKHRLVILPRVLERQATEQSGLAGEALTRVTVRVAYDIISGDDRSLHAIETWGEALDLSDKGTTKALTSAYKYALIQVFCIPVSGADDPDARSVRVARAAATAEPAQGWEQWVADLTEMIRICQTAEALGRVQSQYRTHLQALQRERPILYSGLGESFSARLGELTRAAGAPSPLPIVEPPPGAPVRADAPPAPAGRTEPRTTTEVTTTAADKPLSRSNRSAKRARGSAISVSSTPRRRAGAPEEIVHA